MSLTNDDIVWYDSALSGVDIIYIGLALFHNIDSFLDVNAIKIFLIGNHVPTLLGVTYFSLLLRFS